MPRKRLLQSLAPANFRPPTGRKQVWLPSFRITLLRNKDLPPHMAEFEVPLNLNKLDLKDYLWSAYGVPTLAIRSWIKIEKKPMDLNDQTRRLNGAPEYKRTKHMIAEMADGEGGGPFVWPEEVTDLEPWDNKRYKIGKEETDKALDSVRAVPGTKMGLYRSENRDVDAETAAFAMQAHAMRKRGRKWKPSWQDYIPERREANAPVDVAILAKNFRDRASLTNRTTKDPEPE